MQIDGDALVMCRLVAFAEKEKEHALAVKMNVEEYAQEALKRFQVLYPDAILILGDPKMGTTAWRESLMKNYVQCRIDGIWEFHSAEHSMDIEVRTDGSIHMDEGTAEVIFNYRHD